MSVNNTYRGVCALAGCHSFAFLTFDVEDILSWLAEVDDGGGALALEDGPWTFMPARGLEGYAKCSDDDSELTLRVYVYTPL